MSDEHLIETKVSELLERMYHSENEDKGVTILNESEDEDKKDDEVYKECFRKMLENQKKSISEMSDNEKEKFLEKVKEKCK